MDKQFDELSKSLAEGVSRREALRKFGIGLAGVLLAALGLASSEGARAQGFAQCCNWRCFSIPPEAPGKFNVTTCGSPTCPYPFGFNPGFCKLRHSKTVSDCTACS